MLADANTALSDIEGGGALIRIVLAPAAGMLREAIGIAEADVSLTVMVSKRRLGSSRSRSQ